MALISDKALCKSVIATDPSALPCKVHRKAMGRQAIFQAAAAAVSLPSSTGLQIDTPAARSTRTLRRDNCLS
jgi:hypothetical protein